MQQEVIIETKLSPCGGSAVIRRNIPESECPGSRPTADTVSHSQTACGSKRPADHNQKTEGRKEEMTCTYRMRKDTVYDEEGKAYTVYGIDAIGAGGEMLSSIPDVFFDRQKAQRLVKLCNEGHLSLLHLPDVVEDALAEW